MSSKHDKYAAIVAVDRLEEIVDHEEPTDDESKNNAPFECGIDRHCNIYAIVTYLDASLKTKPSVITSKLLKYDANAHQFIFRMKTKRIGRLRDVILVNYLRNLITDNPEILDETVCDNALNICETIIEGKVKPTQTNLDPIIADKQTVLLQKSATFDDTTYDEPQLDPLTSLSALRHDVFIVDDEKSDNDHDLKAKHQVPSLSDIDFILSKVTFSDDVCLDSMVKAHIKDTLLSNFDVIHSIFPNLENKNKQYLKEYKTAKSVTIVVKIKSASNFNVIISDGIMISNQILLLKISSDTIEARNEIEAYLKLNSSFDRQRICTMYPSTIRYFVHDGITLATAYCMDLCNMNLVTFNRKLSKIYDKLSYEMEMKLRLSPIFEATATCAKVLEKEQLIHTDFKPENIVLLVDFNSKPVIIGKGVSMYPFAAIPIDWGLHYDKHGLKHRHASGLGPTIMGSTQFQPDEDSLTFKSGRLLAFASAMSFVDIWDYAVIGDLKQKLLSNGIGSKAYLQRKLFNNHEDKINDSVIHLLIRVINNHGSIRVIDYLRDELWYLSSLDIAREYVDKIECDNDEFDAYTDEMIHQRLM